MPLFRRYLDRSLLSLRLARARVRGSFVRERDLPAQQVVEGFDAQFAEGEAAYNALGRAGDGVVYFAIGTKRLDTGARLFALDPASRAVRLVADLDKALAPSGPPTVPQGKVHADLVEIDGKMIGATHIGYYDPHASVERPGIATGYATYPGGWFFAVDRVGGAGHESIVPLAQAPAGEGIITMSADTRRAKLHALTWPGGSLLELDLASRALRDRGPVLGAGETGSKRRGDWVRICRSLGVEPESGAVFWSDQAGRIVRSDASRIEVVATTPRSEMWRKVVWHPGHRVFYGVSWSSSTLFRFDPSSLVCEDVGELRVGQARRVPAATLALALDSDHRTIHYLCAGPGVVRERQGQLAGTVWYVSNDLASGKTISTGPLRLHDGRWITQAQSLLVADGAAFAICWVEVPDTDRSPRAERIRTLRHGTRELATRGYAEEMMLVRFAPRV